MTVEASGLLAGGARGGSDPVTVTATDATGIRRVELIDVTNARRRRRSSASRTTPTSRTDANRICDYSQPAPCPSLTRETVRATSLPAGQRVVTVRVTDTGGNVVDSGPYPVFAVTPSDRGALNGAGATETGTLVGDLDQGRQERPAHAQLRHQGRRPRPADSTATASRSPAPR